MAGSFVMNSFRLEHFFLFDLRVVREEEEKKNLPCLVCQKGRMDEDFLRCTAPLE